MAPEFPFFTTPTFAKPTVGKEVEPRWRRGAKKVVAARGSRASGKVMMKATRMIVLAAGVLGVGLLAGCAGGARFVPAGPPTPEIYHDYDYNSDGAVMPYPGPRVGGR